MAMCGSPVLCLQSSVRWVTLAERSLALMLKLLSGHSGLGLDSTPPAIIHVMGRPLYTWTPDLKTIIEVCLKHLKTCPYASLHNPQYQDGPCIKALHVQFAAKEGTRIFFHTTRDPSNAVTLPANLLDFGEGVLPHDNAHFAAVPAGITSAPEPSSLTRLQLSLHQPHAAAPVPLYA